MIQITRDDARKPHIKCEIWERRAALLCRSGLSNSGEIMDFGWNALKYILIVVSAVLLAGLGVVMLYGFIHGDISAFRATLKVLAIACVMVWLYEKWTLLRQA